MKRGRKPKPTNLRVLEGNPGKRRLPAAEPQPDGLPEKPTHLVDEASTEWDRVMPRLERMGLATSIDRAALAAYCQAWARWIEAEGNVKRYGAVIKSPQEFPIQNPWLAVANKALEQMRQFLVEFGMTPASRVRVAELPLIPPKPAERTGTHGQTTRPPTSPPAKTVDRFFRSALRPTAAAGVADRREAGDPVEPDR